MNKELSKTIKDKRTGIEYHLEGDYYYDSKKVLGYPQAIYDCVSGSGSYIPNIVAPKQEKIALNKYGRMRLNYLKEHKKADYTTMLIDGTLSSHLKEIQEKAQTRVNNIIDKLKAKSNLTEDMKNTNQLYWVGTMNVIKNQAEEIVCNELIYI